MRARARAARASIDTLCVLHPLNRPALSSGCVRTSTPAYTVARTPYRMWMGTVGEPAVLVLLCSTLAGVLVALPCAQATWMRVSLE